MSFKQKLEVEVEVDVEVLVEVEVEVEVLVEVVVVMRSQLTQIAVCSMPMAVVDAMSRLKRSLFSLEAKQPGGRSPLDIAAPVVVSSKPMAAAASRHCPAEGMVHQPLSVSHWPPRNFL